MHNITWTKSAKNDLLELVDYIAEENPISAQEFLDKLENMAEHISQFPQLGVGLEKLLPIRQVLINPARLLYIERKSGLIIIACVHQSMDWQTLLTKRLYR